MPEFLAAAGGDYLEQLLRAAVGVPAAAADPAGGRVAARLVIALGAKGEDDRLETHLACTPGRASFYEVTCYDRANRPASRVSDLGAGQAIRAAVALARARSESTVRVVARDDLGGERCVLVARGWDASYQFPTVGAAAPTRPAQEARTSPPAQEAGTSPPAHEAATSPQAQESRARAIEDVPPVRVPDPREAQWVAFAERLESLPTTDEVVTTLREVIGGMTKDLEERFGAVPTTAEVVGALRDLLGGMTLELDATAIEDLFHAALDDLPHVVAAAAGPAEAPADYEMSPAHSGDVGGVGPEPLVPTAVGVYTPATVDINATVAADLVGEEGPAEENHPVGLRDRVSAVVGPARMTNRPSADRIVEDALAIVAISSRRH
ncbi:MAG: hypothetical protein ACR2HV_05480 [Acidimicrobiales bacterium]